MNQELQIKECHYTISLSILTPSKGNFNVSRALILHFHTQVTVSTVILVYGISRALSLSFLQTLIRYLTLQWCEVENSTIFPRISQRYVKNAKRKYSWWILNILYLSTYLSFSLSSFGTL